MKLTTNLSDFCQQTIPLFIFVADDSGKERWPLLFTYFDISLIPS